MNVTVNQIRQEMTALVQAHEMVNSFFWGDFHRAYNEKEQFYPLVCSYLSDGAINTNLTQMQLVVIVCDKTFKGFENLNDTESDTLTVARHLYNVIRQSPRWNALLRVNSSTFTKFYENTSDEVAGVILTMNVDIKQSRSLCDLPLDDYDFDGTFEGDECEPVLIVNSNQSFTFNAPSGTIVELADTPVLVTDQDGNPLANENLPSVTGGTVAINLPPCQDASYVVEYADGTPIESGTIPSGGSATVVVPNCEPCEDATYQLTLNGEPLEGGSGSIPSGENANIPIDEFIPECEPPQVIWDGDSDFPIATLDCGEVLDINCETLINGVVVEGEGDETFIPFFRITGGFPSYDSEVGEVNYTGDFWAIVIYQGEQNYQAEEGTEPFPWLATWPAGVTVRQATISDACCECEPTPCEDATVQINGEEVATVASGGMVNIAVENESGTPIGTFDEDTGVWVVPNCADGVVTVNRDGVFFATQNVASGGTATVNVPSAEWVRPLDWLPMPTVTSAQQTFVGLHAVIENGDNYVAFRFTTSTGQYQVDWGDGTVDLVNSNVNAEHQYDFATYDTGNTTLTSRGYKQAMITVTPVSGNLLTCNFQQRFVTSPVQNQAYSTGFLDCILSMPNASSGASIVFGGFTVRHTYVERVNVLTIGSATNMSSMFVSCFSLQSVPLFNTANVTTMASMFFGCQSLNSIPLFNTANVTNIGSMFVNCYSLQSVPSFNTANVTSMNNMFQTCNSLQSVPLFDTVNVTNMAFMFFGCLSLNSIPALSTAAITSDFGANFANGANSLNRCQMVFQRTVSFANCQLSRDAIVEIFNNLATVTPPQTITITGNWGVTALSAADLLIATTKGWTVVQ
jgi:surface protein